MYEGNFVHEKDTRLSDIYDGYLGEGYIGETEGYQIFIMFAITRQHSHVY
jgi:hypothetical protein